jgi:hypothetical protein
MKHLLAFAVAAAVATPQPVPTIAPIVLPSAAPAATPTLGTSAAPSATPTPSGALTRFSGQILDLRGGFVFFTTGDGFRLDPTYRVVDAVTKQATTIPAATRTYASASFDQNGHVVELALSRKPLAQEASYGDIRRFAVALSSPYPNPDLAVSPDNSANGNEHYTGRTVLVRFTVQVPIGTPLADDVYISTDQSLWDPMAIKLQRIDALHYRIDHSYPSGTKLFYRYTRGTWRSSERGRDGLEEPPRKFVVPESDTKNRNDVVYHWSDENQGSSQNFVNAIPTPFNQSPFITPPKP